MSKMKKPTTFFRIFNILFNGGSFLDIFYLISAMVVDVFDHLSRSTTANETKDD